MGEGDIARNLRQGRALSNKYRAYPISIRPIAYR